MIEICVIVLIILLCIGGFILLTKRKRKKARVSSEVVPNLSAELKPSTLQALKNTDNVPPQRYLKPTAFDMHTFSTPQPAAASLCNDKVLYPINGLGVEYGSKFPDNCPMLQFIQPP